MIEIEKFRSYLIDRSVVPPFYSDYKIPIKELSDQELSLFIASEQVSYCEKRKSSWLVKQLAPLCGEGTLLEAGCGSGRNLFGLHRHGMNNLVGVDLHSDAIPFAKATADFFQMPIQFYQKNILEMTKSDFPNLQVIFSDSVLEHLIEYREVIKIFSNLLPLGGFSVIIVPSIFGSSSLFRDFDYKNWKWRSQSREYHPGQHVNHFWYSSIVKDFQKNNLHLIKTFKFQAGRAIFYEIATRWFKPLTTIFPLLERIDYFISKGLPMDVSSRILIFQKK